MKEFLPERVYFVSGIDTDAGKTIATGYISRALLSEGVKVVTQKLIQTGNHGISEDIRVHRQIEGRDLLPEDLDQTTNPLIYTYPCSPHMAIAIDGKEPRYDLARASTRKLAVSFDKVLLEGAGGLMVPLTLSRLTIDYAKEEGLPVILVTTAKLGSINHTILSLEALQSRGIPLAMLVYNQAIATDDKITEETERYLRGYFHEHAPETAFVVLPKLSF